MSYSWIFILIIVLVSAVYFCVHTGRNYDAHKKNGVKVEAKIINMQKIGATRTGNTRFKLTLQYQTEDKFTEVTTSTTVSPQNLIKIMRKNTVILYYLPEKPESVFLAPWEME